VSVPEKLVTTYLVMRREDFQPAALQEPALDIRHLREPQVAFYRFLYRSVGKGWIWLDRESWDDQRLWNWLARPTTKLYVLYAQDSPAGYIELDYQAQAVCNIAYFGLLPHFFGRGYGKHLLTFGLQTAFDNGAELITVHTCNLDAPAALPNYLARGFKVQGVVEEDLPAHYREALLAP
jgi:GNAT superfamily N-acetyltransferase